jgi:hypothetical protein
VLKNPTRQDFNIDESEMTALFVGADVACLCLFCFSNAAL